MPRPKRHAPPDSVLHLINRGNDRKLLFASPTEYDDFLGLVAEVKVRCPLRILGYCLMPNHWHLLAWPADTGEVSAFCHRLCGVHSMRHRRATGTIGHGHVYQGRFRSFAVRSERQYFDVLRYVEANALRASLVGQAQDWAWSSLAERCGSPWQLLDPGPLRLPDRWVDLVNEGLSPDVLAALRDQRKRGS